MHAGKILTLYPVNFAVELWIENKGVTCIFDNFLRSRAGACQILLSRQRNTAPLTNNWFPLGLLIWIWIQQCMHFLWLLSEWITDIPHIVIRLPVG